MTERRTLRGQVTRASLLTTLLALLLSAALFLGYEFVRSRDERKQDLLAQAQLLAQSVAPALVFNDPTTAMQQLRALQQKRGLRSADLYTARGDMFAHFAADGSAAAARPALKAARNEPVSRFSGSELALEFPVVHDGDRIGTLLLLAEHDLVGRIASYAAFACLAVVLSLALARFLFGRLALRLTSPLAEVANIAQQVMAGRNWGLRAPPSQIQEVSTLVDSFNRMLAEVQKVTAALEGEMTQRGRVEVELRQADRRKDEFLATLAHELRNPLAPMTTAVSILGMPNAPESMRSNAVHMMQRQLKHTVRLIDDLLDVSRVTTGKLTLHAEVVDLNAVLTAAMEAAAPAAGKLELTFQSSSDASPCRVRGDSARLQQVFTNLLNNACKYTPPGGHVQLKLEQAGMSAVVTLTDDGIGIAPSMQSRIFDMFEQVDKSLERGNSGLGVGLTLARQLVELHGGTLSVQSAGLGRGASFAVQLPLLEASTMGQLPRPHSDPTSLGHAMKLLVADDNVDAAVSMQALLQTLGHWVEVVHDGLAAVAAAKAASPDVAVVDIGMPGLNGYEVAKRIRSDPVTSRMGLIALTGWGQAADQERAAAAGFDIHLIKPVEQSVLQEALLRVVRRSDAPGKAASAAGKSNDGDKAANDGY